MKDQGKGNMSGKDVENVDGNKVNGSNYLKLQQSQMLRSTIQSISQLLNTGLNSETLDICIKLIEAGVHPQALAEVVKQIRWELAAMQREE